MRVFINAILVHIFFNLYVFLWGWKIIPPKLAYKIPFIILFFSELVAYLIGFVYIDELPLNALYYIMTLGTSWMVFILYMTGMLAGYDILRISGRWIKTIPRKLKPKSLKRRRIYYFSSVIIVCVFMLHGSYCFWHPSITEVNIETNKTTQQKNLKIVMVSDIHAGYIINKDVLKMYVDLIMEQKPDLILLAGDIIDYNMNPVEEEHMEDEFKRLKAPLGTYAITGNHEYRLNAEEKIEWLRDKAELTVLRDSVVLMNDDFYVVGRDDKKNRKRKPLNQIIQDINKERPIIVMNHQPYDLSEESNENVDLAVYGHTHNGQLFPYNILIKLVYEVSYGYKKKDNTHIYVSSGLGLSGPQYRIGTKSEIVVINLKTK